jgi:hypothetical protein
MLRKTPYPLSKKYTLKGHIFPHNFIVTNLTCPEWQEGAKVSTLFSLLKDFFGGY